MAKTINIDLFKKLYYDEQLSIKEILNKLDVEKGILYYVMEKNNLPKRKVHYSTKYYKDITKDLLEKLYINDRKSIPSISEELNIPTSAIYSKIKEFNLPINPVGGIKLYEFNKEDLYHKYWIENKNTYEIANEMGVVQSTISKAMRDLGIPTRSNKIDFSYITREILYKKYIEENKTTYETAKELGTSQSTISKCLAKHEIETRFKNSDISHITKEILYEKYIEENKTTYEVARELNVAQSTIFKCLIKYEISIRTSHPNTSHVTKEILFKKYIEEKLDTRMIAKELGVAQSTIFNLLKVNNIQTRTQAETQRGKVGSLARAWKGGLSYRPYCYKFNKPLKEEIRKNFGRVCFICEKTQRDEEKNLCIHHVNYDKSQECDRNCILIPLCNFCHLRTNGNRWYYFNLLFHYWARNLEICLSFPGGFPEFYPHYFEIV